MLDAMLGRSNFYSKCKSLIKQTRTRIEVVRRKRNATQKFLQKDIAELLANNLDTNAFARADGFISELILSSCYDFIDHVCEIVLKHLSVLQKLRECPEDCREAVASLMFAAARFSDLPELRDLRDLFQERYGISLEFYVNQKLVENINSKPPSVENKIQILQDIALEFSVKWESRNFHERMSNPVPEEKPRPTPKTLHVNKNKVPPPLVEVSVQKTVEDEPIRRNVDRGANGRHQLGTQWDSVPGRKDDLKHNVSKKPESTKTPYSEETIQKLEDHGISFQRREHLAGVRDVEKNTSIKDAVQTDTSSHGNRLDCVDNQHKVDKQRLNHVPKNNGIDFPSPKNNELEDSHASHGKSMRKQQDDVTDGPKSNFRGGIPPPYVKPGKSKNKTDVDCHREENDTLTFKPASNGNRAEKLQTKADSRDHHNRASAIGDGDGPTRFTEVYYKDEPNVDFTPRRRSHRRKHSRSASSQDIEVSGEERVLRRVSTSRSKHVSKKSLQIVVADDEEERIIDKLLLHYSKKPSSSEPGKSGRKANASKSSHHKALDVTNLNEDSTPTTSRSFSLPSRQVTEPKQEKVFTRAASFQQDTPAKHVHPKLPDYDDLAARFAALRAAKD